jgi:hypothetical protein
MSRTVRMFSVVRSKPDSWLFAYGAKWRRLKCNANLGCNVNARRQVYSAYKRAAVIIEALPMPAQGTGCPPQGRIKSD